MTRSTAVTKGDNGAGLSGRGLSTLRHCCMPARHGWIWDVPGRGSLLPRRLERANAFVRPQPGCKHDSRFIVCSPLGDIWCATALIYCRTDTYPNTVMIQTPRLMYNLRCYEEFTQEVFMCGCVATLRNQTLSICPLEILTAPYIIWCLIFAVLPAKCSYQSQNHRQSAFYFSASCRTA